MALDSLEYIELRDGLEIAYARGDKIINTLIEVLSKSVRREMLKLLDGTMRAIDLRKVLNARGWHLTDQDIAYHLKQIHRSVPDIVDFWMEGRNRYYRVKQPHVLLELKPSTFLALLSNKMP